MLWSGRLPRVNSPGTLSTESVPYLQNLSSFSGCLTKTYMNLYNIIIMLDNYTSVGRTPEAYGSRFVCVYLYVCNVFLRDRHKLGTGTAWCDNISNLIVSDFWFKALFSSYSVICSPWRPLREIQSQAKTKLFTAGCFFTRQSRLCHRPGSNMSENMKTRVSKASCHLLVRRSVAAI